MSRRNNAFVIAALLIVISRSLVAAENKIGSVKDVVVEKVELSLPKNERNASQILWKEFANQPAEMMFSHIKVAGWRKFYSEFVKELESKAVSANLEFLALNRILKEIDNKRSSLAVLPVGAYQAKYGDKTIWIVVCKWENEAAGSNPNVSLGHVRMFAYEINSLELVAYETCM